MIRASRMSTYVTVSFFLGFAQYAHADAVGMLVEDVTDAAAQGMGLSVCKVYAEFDVATDYMFYVAFSDFKTNDPAGFWHHPFGNDKAPPQVLVDLYPRLAYDSFVTIGWEVVPAGEFDNTTFDPDWNSLEFNNNGHALGGWYNFNPTGSQGYPQPIGTTIGVLVGKLSFSEGSYVYGDVTAFYNDGYSYLQDCFTCYFCDTCQGDLNCDGRVESADLSVLLGAWGSNPCHPADLDGDGTVGSVDLAIILGNWGTCP